MTDLPDGWDHYDPDDHERTSDPEYRRARDAAAARAAGRRSAYGTALAGLRQARSVTQVTLAAQLGVSQGEVSRIEHQADLLLSTIARYVDAVGGELTLVVRFPGQASIELSPSEVLDERTGEGALSAPPPAALEIPA